uniref:Uncharacterized protein n=1 Tax=Tanacetum cinerariifolium TaxID=118510 RepID=A0A6L2JCL3_TANCI|nr:hypothetical protein [Tanacetum cinerariifolium]
MPPRMRTRSAGLPAAESLGGGTGVRGGRGRRGRSPSEGNDERVDDLKSQGNNQGMGANEGVKGVNIGNVINENVQENVGNVIVNGNRVGCSYKEFLAGSPKEYDATEPKTIQKAVQISGALIDEAVRNGSIKKVEKRGNVEEPSKDKSDKDDNKRTRTRNVFDATVNPVEIENTGLEVQSIFSYVTERPDSDSGKKKFKSLMKFIECNSKLDGIHESDGFGFVLSDYGKKKFKLLMKFPECNSELDGIHESDGFSFVLSE